MTFQSNHGLYNSGSYYPNKQVINAITLGLQTLVTTLKNHHFEVGNLLILYVPVEWGTRQLNTMTGYVLSIPAANQVLLEINSVGFDPFVTPSLPPYQVVDVPEIMSVGDGNTGSINPGPPDLIIPGAFFNTYP